MEAHVEHYHGEPAIMIDGKPYPPMTMTCRIDDPGYLKRLGEAGIRIFFIGTQTNWLNPGDPEKGIPDAVAAADRSIETLMQAVPDAWVILRLSVSPPKEWIEAHPEEMVMYSDGSHKPVICTSSSGEVISGMWSLTSEAWQEAEDRALAEYVEGLKESPWYDRIAGFFLCSGGTDEWYYPGTPMVDEATGAYVDFSPAFRKYYGDFLRERYGTEDALRRAWNMPDASFADPRIPSPEDTVYTHKAHETISTGLENWERVSYTVGLDVDMNAKRSANIGIFLDMKDHRYAADFFDAWHAGTADTIVHFAGTLKKLMPGRMIGAFYGSLGCTDFFELGTASGTLRILDSGAVDFLAAPGVYNNREPGGVVAQREMQDSFRIRNMIYVCEEDSRTHRALMLYRNTMGVCTAEDTKRTLKRDFARNLLEDIQGWWFDMGSRRPSDPLHWYDDPELLGLIRRQEEIADFAYALDRTKQNEIAVIASLNALHTVTDAQSRMLLDHYRTSDLHRIGAPYDTYYAEDLARPDMPDYKLYLMLNLYSLTDAQREAIFAKARRNHAVVAWLYAPGFIDPEGEDVQCAGNIEKTTGMHVTMGEDTAFPYFKVTDLSHPALKYADPNRRYGYIDRDVHSNVWLKASELSFAYRNPAFSIDDPEVTVLGRYTQNGDVAYALREMDGFASVYCSSQILRSELIASLASYAGCHLYEEGDDVIFANENFVCVHAKERGTRILRFKHPCSPFEVYEKRFYGENVTELTLHMELGDTLMFSLKGEC